MAEHDPGAEPRRMGRGRTARPVGGGMGLALTLAGLAATAGLTIAGLALAGLVGCQRKGGAEVLPVPLTREAVCAVDGMTLLDYPGPKGQIHERDGKVRYFCDLKEFFEALHDPDRAHRIAQAFVQPFDGREWGSYADGWAAWDSLVYVLGSHRSGAMGPTLVPFRSPEAAEDFIAREGGRRVMAAELTPEVIAHYRREVREAMRRGAPGGGLEQPPTDPEARAGEGRIVPGSSEER